MHQVRFELTTSGFCDSHTDYCALDTFIVLERHYKVLPTDLQVNRLTPQVNRALYSVYLYYAGSNPDQVELLNKTLFKAWTVYGNDVA